MSVGERGGRTAQMRLDMFDAALRHLAAGNTTYTALYAGVGGEVEVTFRRVVPPAPPLPPMPFLFHDLHAAPLTVDEFTRLARELGPGPGRD